MPATTGCRTRGHGRAGAIVRPWTIECPLADTRDIAKVTPMVPERALEGRVLIVDDDPDIQTAGRLLLGRHVEHVVCSSSPDDIPGLLASQVVDVIVLDMNYGVSATSGIDGLTWLDRICVQHPDVAVIAATAY